jgi:hypothetical protein
MDNKDDSIQNNTLMENTPKKRGRPKKYNFQYSNRTEYDQKRYQENQEQMKLKIKENYIKNKDIIIQKQLLKYSENKQELKEKSKKLQSKYRQGYKLLLLLYNNDHLHNIDNNILDQIKNILD